MYEIELFGSSTPAGNYFKKNYRKYLVKSNLNSFSRTGLNDIYFDLTNSEIPKKLYLKNDTLIVSLAPIWIFIPFLKKYLPKINASKIKGLIVTSSTSVLTKNYSWSYFDKKLYEKSE